MPIRLIHDRWTSKYAEPWVGALADLKVNLEAPATDRPRHVFQVYIRTTPEAAVAGDQRPGGHPALFSSLARRVRLAARPRIGYWIDDELVVEGDGAEADPPRKLVTTWSFRRSPEMRDDPPSRVTWEIEPIGDDDLPAHTACTTISRARRARSRA